PNRFQEFWADKREPEDLREFTEGLVVGAWIHRDRLDEVLRQTAANWALERMAAVDRSLLRLAAYELLFRPDIPTAVAINEALEIAKEFSTLDSASFINGLLDQIARRVPDETGAEEKPEP
ncbi:MAG: transcription antitermination factor NusB, partial [Thermodesulfobacteriota bacterium]